MWGINSHYFHILWEGHKPNSKGMHIPIVGIPTKGRMTMPNVTTWFQRIKDPPGIQPGEFEAKCATSESCSCTTFGRWGSPWSCEMRPKFGLFFLQKLFGFGWRWTLSDLYKSRPGGGFKHLLFLPSSDKGGFCEATSIFKAFPFEQLTPEVFQNCVHDHGKMNLIFFCLFKSNFSFYHGKSPFDQHEGNDFVYFPTTKEANQRILLNDPESVILLRSKIWGCSSSHREQGCSSVGAFFAPCCWCFRNPAITSWGW